MVDISAITGMLSALKSAVDIAQTMKTLGDTAALQAKIGELNSKILDAQMSAFAANDERATLIERVSELEKELARFETWEAEKQRYELKEIEPGAVAYVPKESMRDNEPIHWLCAQCYNNNKKGFLQSHHGDASFTYYKCQGCGGEIRVRKPPSPPRQAVANTRYNPLRRY
jgi:hypothetical protein